MFVPIETAPIISFIAEHYVDFPQLTTLDTFVGLYNFRFVVLYLLDEWNNLCEALRDVLVQHHNH